MFLFYFNQKCVWGNQTVMFPKIWSLFFWAIRIYTIPLRTRQSRVRKWLGSEHTDGKVELGQSRCDREKHHNKHSCTVDSRLKTQQNRFPVSGAWTLIPPAI